VVWVLLTVIPLVSILVLAASRIRASRKRGPRNSARSPVLAVEIIVPLKGQLEGQEILLQSLLDQRYEDYRLTFVLESDDDPGISMVDKLCSRYPHARKVISGTTDRCAQKNHSLIAGVRNLRKETEVIVFCDSTNAADPQWLEDFTAPIRSGEAHVVTTFRAFDPRPETLAGVCQAIYASFILTLLMIKPKPWGGATGIRRRTFEDLNVVDIWSRTVVDDLVLGNILEKAGVSVHMAPRHLLQSPLRNQTVSGFLGYLDRQILFPKFTNPGIWLSTLVVILSLSSAIVVASVIGLLYPFGYGSPVSGVMSYAFLLIVAVSVLGLREMNPFSISIKSWVLAVLPLLGLASFVYIRSVFVNHIDWHGKRYLPGKGGVVLCATAQSPRGGEQRA
jgi:ceramide glucosyltransferase